MNGFIEGLLQGGMRMKRVKTSIVIMGIIIMCMCVCSVIGGGKWGLAENGGGVYEINNGKNSSKEFSENNAKAVEAYNAFFQHYYEKQREESFKSSGYTVNCVAKEYLPDFFGGAYVNKNGNLVMGVTEEYNTDEFYQSDTYKEILDLTKLNSEDVVIRFVETSYTDLMRGMEVIKDFNWSDYGIDSLGYGIDDYNNEIEIDIPSVSRNKRSQIEKELQDKMQGIPYRINEKGFDFVDEVGVYPGENVHCGDNIVYSFAFPVRILESGCTKLDFLHVNIA